jgi:hypothetical protein
MGPRMVCEHHTGNAPIPLMLIVWVVGEVPGSANDSITEKELQLQTLN